MLVFVLTLSNGAGMNTKTISNFPVNTPCACTLFAFQDDALGSMQPIMAEQWERLRVIEGDDGGDRNARPRKDEQFSLILLGDSYGDQTSDDDATVVIQSPVIILLSFKRLVFYSCRSSIPYANQSWPLGAV